MTRLWHLLYVGVIGLVLVISREPEVDPVAFQSALIEHTQDYENITWLGRDIWKPVLDVWTIQETFSRSSPSC